MTKQEIRRKMVKMIEEAILSELAEMDIEDEITEEDIHEFMWCHDFGINDFYESYKEENSVEIKETFLNAIYEDIDVSDIGLPW